MRYGIYFEQDGPHIKLRENKEFQLNNNPKIKEKLKETFDLRFNSKNLWHIGERGKLKLQKKRIKV